MVIVTPPLIIITRYLPSGHWVSGSVRGSDSVINTETTFLSVSETIKKMLISSCFTQTQCKHSIGT